MPSTAPDKNGLQDLKAICLETVTSSEQCCIALVQPKGMPTLIATNLATNKFVAGERSVEDQAFEPIPRHLSPESKSRGDYANMAFMHRIGERCMFVGWGYIYMLYSLHLVL